MALLEIEQANGIRRLTLNRPEARNALDPALAAALIDALREAERDDATRCVILAAAGPVFCAGGDLKDMQARRARPDLTHARQKDTFARLARALHEFEKPILARVQGDAHGAGVMVAALCDYAIAAHTARIGITFSRAGLVPDTGASWLLPRLVGLRAARELYLEAAVLTAARAAELGLLTKAVAADALDEEVDGIAQRLARGATRAYGLGKRALREGAASSFEDALAREATLQGLAFAAEDQKEAVDAVLAKREPRLTGR